MYTKENAVFPLSVWYSHSSSMVNVFGVWQGNLQVVKTFVVTEGKFKDYTDEIQQSYELGFTPYRLHTNADGTFVTPIRYYDGKVYVLYDVATVEVGDWHLETDTISSKLVYFVKGNIGPRGVHGAKGLRGVAGIQGPLGVQGPVGSTGEQGERGPKGNYVIQGLDGDKGDRGERGERGVKGEKGIQGDNSDV